MPSVPRLTAVFTALAATAAALNGVVAPSTVAAGSPVEVTFQDANNNDQYRVFLAAALQGSNGPTCYLVNATSLSSGSISVTVPAGVGPTADYYSIAISDITTGQGATYSNRFNLTGANGNYSSYENHLGGSPFWSADDLPCTAYSCARECAEASYPDDLTSTSAYDTMKACILHCKGVTPAANQTAPAHATSSAASTVTGEMAVITLGPSLVLTAVETVVTSDGSAITQAVVGDRTITLGGEAQNVNSAEVSLASKGIEVGGSTTVAFSSTTATVGGTTTVAADAAAATAKSSSAASKKDFLAGLAAAGFAGIAFFV